MTATLPVTYTPGTPVWCSGCGHFGVLNALRAAVKDLAVPQHELVVLAGIGCSGTIQNYTGSYGYHALHGRVLPAATGVALANPNLTVVGAGGDGDGYAIGAGHLVHAFRRNPSFVYLLMNNETYGLTKGQRSPGRLIETTPGGEGALDGPALGLAIPESTFVARGYSGRFEQLVDLTRAALEHARAKRGFAFLEIVSPCVTYQDTYPQWEHVLEDVTTAPGYDRSDRIGAFAAAARASARGKIASGLLYQAAPPAAPRTLPAPALASIDPVAQRSAYAALLNRYAPGAVKERKAKKRPEVGAAAVTR